MSNENMLKKLKRIRNYKFFIISLITISFFISVYVNLESIHNHLADCEPYNQHIISNSEHSEEISLSNYVENQSASVIRNHIIFWFLGISLTFIFGWMIKKEVISHYKSEEKYESLIDSAPFPIVLHIEGKLIFANNEALNLLEVDDVNDFFGKDILDFVHQDSFEIAKERVNKINEGFSEVDTLIERFITAKGNSVYVEVKAKRVIHNDKPTTMVIFHNITDRKIWIDKLKSSEANLKTLLNNNRISFILFDTNRNAVYYNLKSIELFSKIYKSETNAEVTIKKFFKSDVSAQFLNCFNEALSGTTCTYENEQKTNNGEILYLQSDLHPVKTENGEITGVVLALTDITDLKISQINLEENKARLKIIYNNTNIGILLTDKTGIIEYSNPSFSKILKYPNQEIIGKKVSAFTNPDDYQIELEHINNLKEGKSNSFTLEKRYITKFDEEVWTRINITCTRNENGSIKYLTGIVEDISDRKQAEIELKRSNLMKDILSTSIMNSPLGMILWEVEEHDTKIVDWNKASENIFEWKKEEAINKNFFDLITILPGLIPGSENGKVKKNENYPSCYLTESTTKSGIKIIIYLYNTAMYNQESGVIRIMSLVQDVTEQKKIEKELIIAKEEAEKADRLKSEFLAQMSHEIRTPINAMLSFSSLIKEDVKEYSIPDIEESFQIISTAGDRIIRTTDLLINMAELQTNSHDFNPHLIDIKEDILTNLYASFKPFAKKKHLDINFIFEAEKTKVFADEYMLIKIFDNLIDNAIKFTTKGSIEIKVQNPIESIICVNVKDTGIGISEEYMRNLFKPFSQEESGYTRKFEGNGLGLALVKKYCDLNKAEIIVESEKGSGTSFQVYLQQMKN